MGAKFVDAEMMDRWFYQMYDAAKRNKRIDAELWGAYRKDWRANWSPARNIRTKYHDNGIHVDVVHAWWRHPLGEVSFVALMFRWVFCLIFVAVAEIDFR